MPEARARDGLIPRGLIRSFAAKMARRFKMDNKSIRN